MAAKNKSSSAREQHAGRGKGKRTDKAKAASRLSRKTTSKSASSKGGATTAKAVRLSEGKRSTVVESVRARFTEPLRRASEFENIRELVSAQAHRFGDKPFLRLPHSSRQVSFHQLHERSNRAANLLRSQLNPESRVVISIADPLEFSAALIGVLKAGMVAVPVDVGLPAQAFELIARDCEAAGLFTDGQAADVAGLQAVFGPDLNAALEGASSEDVPADAGSWWDEAIIAYTGERGGAWKGAILQQRQLLTAARWLSVWLRLDESQCVLSPLPLHQVNTQIVALFTPLLTGGSAVLPRGFDASRLWPLVEEHGVTVLVAVPDMLNELTQREHAEAANLQAAPDCAWPAPQESPGALRRTGEAEARSRGVARAHDIRSLHSVICGGEALPAHVQAAFERCFLVPVIEGYCMAETTGFAALNARDGTRRIGSVGRPVGLKIAVQDDSHRPMPLEDWQPQSLLRMSPAVFPTAEYDEPGEICIWGETVLKEYLKRPKLNPEAFAGGWFHSGDQGRLDRDGYMYIDGKQNPSGDQ